MTRAKRAIIKAAANRGYVVDPNEFWWEPIGPNIEMQGPDGGWYVAVEDDNGHHFVGGLNLQMVLDNIARLKQGTIAPSEALQESLLPVA